MNREKIRVLQQDDGEKGNGYLRVTRLIDIGKRKSYVTINDIFKVFPEAEKDANPTIENEYENDVRRRHPEWFQASF